MRNFLTQGLVAFVLIGMMGGALVAEEQAYVVSLYAKVRSTTGFPSKTVAELERGTQVTVMATKDTWSKVTLADGRTGYVSTRHLGEDAPDDSSALGSLGRMSRREGGDVAGTAGGRGVGPVATKYASSKNASAALADVEWLEKLPMDTDALDAFMGEGGLGEFQ